MPNDLNSFVLNRSTRTTDATVTTLDTIPVYPGSIMHFDTLIIGKRTGGASGSANDDATYHLQVSYKDVSGTATILGAETRVENEDQAGWDAAFSVSGGNVLLRVTGASGNNITWTSKTVVTRIQ